MKMIYFIDILAGYVLAISNSGSRSYREQGNVLGMTLDTVITIVLIQIIFHFLLSGSRWKFLHLILVPMWVQNISVEQFNNLENDPIALFFYYEFVAVCMLLLMIIGRWFPKAKVIWEEYRREMFNIALLGLIAIMMGDGMIFILPLIYFVWVIVRVVSDAGKIVDSSAEKVLAVKVQDWFQFSMWDAPCMNTVYTFYPKLYPKRGMHKKSLIYNQTILTNWTTYSFLGKGRWKEGLKKVLILLPIQNKAVRNQFYKKREVIQRHISALLDDGMEVCLVVTGVLQNIMVYGPGAVNQLGYESILLPEWEREAFSVISTTDWEIPIAKVDYFLFGEDGRENVVNSQVRAKNKSAEIFAKISKEEKNNFLRTTLENVIGNYSDADCFYQIFRMAEYIFHYQALLTLRNKRIDLEDYSASFGLWSKWGMDFLNLRERQAESKEVSMSYNRLVKIVRREGRTRLNCTYREVAELLNEMRNKYIGHGSMAFSVSADMNYDLLVLLDWLIELFVGQEVLLGEGYFLYQKESIKLQNGKGLLSYWQEADENWVLEYLDYEEGKVERLGNCLRINLEGSM